METKKIYIFCLLMIFIVFFSGISLAANSLWSEDSRNLFTDRSEFIEGEIVTVVIEENASAIQSASTDTVQSSSVEAEGRIGFLNLVGSFLFGYSEEDFADGETGRQGMIEAKITTEIVEITENGNLIIEGEKRLTINEEDQIIKLSGTVRPQDIDLDNQISSERVANAVIEYKGEGVIADKQRPGLFSRIFNWLF